MVNRANIKISYEIFLYMLGIKPGAVGCEASMLSNVLCSPLHTGNFTHDVKKQLDFSLMHFSN